VVKTPPAIVNNQKHHRHPIACVTNPPLTTSTFHKIEGESYITGPTTGPKRGPRLNAAVAAPIFSLRNASAIIPPPILKTAEPPIPANNRKVIKVPMEFALAQPIWNMVKTILPA
jgi:hypothetical protein